jgi:two-component sensor histidine kinase
MGATEIVLYLFGIIFFLSTLIFAYYTFSNARLMRGPLGHQTMAMGAGFFIIAAIIGAVDHFFLPGSGLVYAEFSVWVTGLWMIISGGVLRAKEIQRVNRVSLFQIFTVIPHAKIYLIGIALLSFVSMPISLASVLSPLRAETKWFNAINMIIWAFAFTIMAVSERRFCRAVRPLATTSAESISEEEMLLRDDILVLRACSDLASRLSRAIIPITGIEALRNVLNKYTGYSILKDCEISGAGALIATEAIENLTNIPKHEGIAKVFDGFSSLIPGLINLYSAVASSDLSKEMVALSYEATKARYGDMPGFPQILKTIPPGFLEEEKLSLLSKEELETQIRKRTQELEDALMRAAKATEALHASRASFHNIVERNTDGIVVVDQTGAIRFFNPAVKSILGPKYMPLLDELFGSRVVTGEIKEIDIIHTQGEKSIVELRLVETEWEGEIAYLALLRDITERKRAEGQLKASLREKEVLLQEIHHRVKNNLQVISSLLSLQSGYVEDPKAHDIFRDSQNRIRSMALIHEKLYRSQDLSRIDSIEYIHHLVTYLFRVHSADIRAIALSIQTGDVSLGMDAAVPFGLILNELVSNALKHAFPGDRTGKISVDLHTDGDQYVLLVKDDGVGFPQDLDFRNTTSLGLQLVNSLVKQLDGTIEMYSNGGTKFTVTFCERQS